MLRPIVAAEERRAGAHLIGAPRAVTVRDQVGLRALNDLLKAAFDQPGSAGAEAGKRPAQKPPPSSRSPSRQPNDLNASGHRRRQQHRNQIPEPATSGFAKDPDSTP